LLLSDMLASESRPRREDFVMVARTFQLNPTSTQKERV